MDEMAIKRNNWIDAMRMIAAIFVVTIHIGGTIGNVIEPISRFAVPFFFVLSGYFYATMNDQKKRKQIIRILVLSILASLLYMSKQFFFAFRAGVLGEYLSEILTHQMVVKVLLCNVNPFSSHLWYLSAFLYALIIFYMTDKLHIRKYVLSVFPLLLIANLVLGTYSNALFGYQIDIECSRNFLFCAIPFMSIGIRMRDLDVIHIPFKVKSWHLPVLICLFATTSFLERGLLKHLELYGNGEVFISTILLVMTLFSFLLCIFEIPCGKICAIIAGCGARYSLPIYIIHVFWRDIFSGILSTNARVGGVLHMRLFYLLQYCCFLSFAHLPIVGYHE